MHFILPALLAVASVAYAHEHDADAPYPSPDQTFPTPDQTEPMKSFQQIPPCAFQCVQEAVAKSGCNLTDVACQCTTGAMSEARILDPCLCKSKCTPADWTAFSQFSVQVCSAAVPHFDSAWTRQFNPSICSGTMGGAVQPSPSPSPSPSNTMTHHAPYNMTRPGTVTVGGNNKTSSTAGGNSGSTVAGGNSGSNVVGGANNSASFQPSTGGSHKTSFDALLAVGFFVVAMML